MTAFSLVELQQAARNHGMPLEALRYDITPVGLHYLLIHYDIPPVDPQTWRLEIGGRGARPASGLTGHPPPPQHGYPLRLVVPGWYGMTNVKWVTRITASAETFVGYQQRYAYRLRVADDEEGRPLDRIRPRALLIPPGIPEFPSRARTVPLGSCMLEG